MDAVSDDGRDALTVIAFIGSVFSPYYWKARATGPAAAEDFCAINVALYGRRRRWAMTERGRGALHRTARTLTIGPSSVQWRDGELVLDLDESCYPFPGAVRGRIRISAANWGARTFPLDEQQRHRWRPLAPEARAVVELERPGISWRGHAYVDCNDGDRPLADDFVRWDWARAPLSDGAVIMYDAQRRDGGRLNLGLRFGRDGALTETDFPPQTRLPRTRWLVPRIMRSEGAAHVVRTLEDTPFYARSLVATELLGQRVVAVHESLDLDRLRSPVVQFMLPYRMPRRP